MGRGLEESPFCIIMQVHVHFSLTAGAERDAEPSSHFSL